MISPPDAGEAGKTSTDVSRTLSQMIMGFRTTQLIYVAAKLSIADLLKDGPQSVDALARATGTHAPSLYRLLRALSSLGIFAEDEQGSFATTPLADLLRSGAPGSQRPAALVFGEEWRWRAWGELLYSVRTGEPAYRHIHGMDPWEYQAGNPEVNTNFNDYMTSNTAPQTSSVVAAYDYSGISTLVDVGGGHGMLLSAILQANPDMHGILCDAPHVAAGARPLLEAAGVADRCEIQSCDFFSAVPAGGDAYILKFIIHDWDDEHALAILKSCRRVMPENGRLLLVENVIPPGNGPHPGKLTDIQMLLTLGGRERTEEEFRTLLGETGFKLTRVVPTQGPLSIIEGVPQ